MAIASADPMLDFLRGTIIAIVRRDDPDLTCRQLSVFLVCYLHDDEQTVRGMAGALNISKPAISRALDRLAEADLLRRKPDPRDRRSVLVHRTAKGTAFLRELKKIVREAAVSAGEALPASRHPVRAEASA
jgi:DNA-binding MarR family transcriptional regulator